MNREQASKEHRHSEIDGYFVILRFRDDSLAERIKLISGWAEAPDLAMLPVPAATEAARSGGVGGHF